MKMDEVELLRRTCVNMKQIDEFFNGKEYQSLINAAITLAQSNNKNSAEYLLAQVDLLDASIDFFTDKKEWSVFIFMAANNDLSPYSDLDLAEI